jgi:hypothetical protein
VPPEGELAVTVPADYVVVPAGSGARLIKLRPLSLYPGSITVSVVDSGEKKLPEAAEEATAGKLLGRPIEWRGKATPKGGFLFAAEPLRLGAPGTGTGNESSKAAEILVKATRQAKSLEEMRGVAETLALVKRRP